MAPRCLDSSASWICPAPTADTGSRVARGSRALARGPRSSRRERKNRIQSTSRPGSSRQEAPGPWPGALAGCRPPGWGEPPPRWRRRRQTSPRTPNASRPRIIDATARKTHVPRTVPDPTRRRPQRRPVTLAAGSARASTRIPDAATGPGNSRTLKTAPMRYHVDEATWSRSRGDAKRRSSLKKRRFSAGFLSLSQSMERATTNPATSSGNTNGPVDASRASRVTMTTPDVAWNSRRPN